jgi:GDPmannose 4,6-dehydratase
LALMRPECKAFYAASCHIFGQPTVMPQDERTPHFPISPYGVTKSAGLRLCQYFRDSRKLFVVGGILYNHESPRRRPPFITARIVNAAAMVAIGKGRPIYIRAPDTIVDWGAAPDYVEAMWLSLQQPLATDYIIATGVPRTIWDFANAAFECVGARAVDWITSEPSASGGRALPYVGNNSKLVATTQWNPRVTFGDLVHWMVDEAVENARG